MKKIITSLCVASLIFGQVSSADTVKQTLIEATDDLAANFNSSWSTQVQESSDQLTDLVALLTAFQEFRDRIAIDDATLTAAEQAELQEIGDQLETKLDETAKLFRDTIGNVNTPAHLKALVDSVYMLRCAGFLTTLSKADSKERQVILNEISFCSAVTNDVFEKLDAYQDQLEDQLESIDDEIAALLDKNSLTDEEKQRLTELQNQKQQTKQKIDEVKEEKKRQFDLKMLLAFATIIAGVVLMAYGVPAGDALVEAGVSAAFGTAAQHMMDDITEKDKTAIEPNENQTSADNLAALYDAEPTDPPTAAELATRSFEGEIIASAETGRVYFTADALGTENARIRIYSVADNSVLFDLTANAVAAGEKGLNLPDISMISRIAFIEELQDSDILAYRLTTKSAVSNADPTQIDQFLYLQLVPLINGYVSLAVLD